MCVFTGTRVWTLQIEKIPLSERATVTHFYTVKPFKVHMFKNDKHCPCATSRERWEKHSHLFSVYEPFRLNLMMQDARCLALFLRAAEQLVRRLADKTKSRRAFAQPLFPYVGPRPPTRTAVLPQGRITPSLGENALSEGRKNTRGFVPNHGRQESQWDAADARALTGGHRGLNQKVEETLRLLQSRDSNLTFV